ncbi:unnamed protein product [Calypogeia fissa]
MLAVGIQCRTRPRAIDRSIDPATTVIIIIRLPSIIRVSAWTIPRPSAFLGGSRRRVNQRWRFRTGFSSDDGGSMM